MQVLGTSETSLPLRPRSCGWVGGTPSFCHQSTTPPSGSHDDLRVHPSISKEAPPNPLRPRPLTFLDLAPPKTAPCPSRPHPRPPPHASSEPVPPRAPQQVLFPLPTPLPVFALLTGPGSELPAVCIGVSPGRPPKSVLFHTVRFGALSCWLGEMSTSERGGAGAGAAGAGSGAGGRREQGGRRRGGDGGPRRAALERV